MRFIYSTISHCLMSISFVIVNSNFSSTISVDNITDNDAVLMNKTKDNGEVGAINVIF